MGNGTADGCGTFEGEAMTRVPVTDEIKCVLCCHDCKRPAKWFYAPVVETRTLLCGLHARRLRGSPNLFSFDSLIREDVVKWIAKRKKVEVPAS